MKRLINWLKGKKVIKLEDLLILAAEQNLKLILKREVNHCSEYLPITIELLRKHFPHHFSKKFYYIIIDNIIFIERF